MKYARVLLNHCPAQTTELFKTYYTGQYRPRTQVELPAEPQAQPSSTLQSLAGMLPLRYMTGGAGLQAPATVSEPVVTEEPVVEPAPEYETPKPRTAFSAFVDHPKEFIEFLETLVQQPGLSKESQVDLFTTLFEMYLDAAKGKKDAGEKQEWETKAKRLIEGKDVSIHISAKSTKLTDTDSNLHFQCSPSVRLVQFPRRVYASARTRRSSSGHLPLIHIRQRYSGRNQGIKAIWARRATAIRRRVNIFRIQPANHGGSWRRT